MTQLKSLLLIILFFCLSPMLRAERTYRLEVGYNQTHQASKEFRNTYLDGGMVGGTVDFHLPYNMTVQTGLSYQMTYGFNEQHFTTKSTEQLEIASRNIYNHTIAIPVYYTYTQKIWNKLALFAYVGPKVQIGLTQSEKLTSTLSSDKEALFGIASGTTDAYQTKDLSRFNLQFSLGGGVQWDKYRIKSGYDFGMFNVSNQGKIHQKGWYASLSYAF